MERSTREAILQFVRSQPYAVEASSSPAGPQAAVVGFVVTDDFELFFDSVDSTRKVANLRKDPRIAFVIGGLAPSDERTVQVEGVADEPGGAELERLRNLYFTRFPDGRDRLAWPGLTYIRVRPTWIRFSDFSRNPPQIIELTLDPRTA